MQNDDSISNNKMPVKRMRSAYLIKNVIKRFLDKMKFNSTGKNSDFFEIAVRF